MPHHVETDITVQRFGFTGDAQGRRLSFPRAEAHAVEGRSGTLSYGAHDLLFDKLEGRLDALRWTADAASVGKAWLRDDAGRVDVKVDRIEMSRGAMLTRADRGVELIAPHVTLSEMRLTAKGPFGRKEPVEKLPVKLPATEQELRQNRLKFLDSLSGHINLTIKVVLDLPVLGVRTLDQDLAVPIHEGSLDYRALDESLDWLEGTFLDIKHDDDKLAVTWKVPIFGSSRDLVAWRLDQEAATLASFGRVPVRSLADFIVSRSDAKPREKEKKSSVLVSLSLAAIDVVLSLMAPRSFDVAGGLVMFGGDDQPGMVDLKVTGGVNDRGPGSLTGRIGSIDTTIKDVRLGPATLAADRLHFDGLDELEVTFEGFRPQCVTVIIHRVTATNLMLQLAGRQT